ncbi:competence protein ComK [Oceanobacillus bengalensis]|uniref:Competence protein n=1 Tax=Oceanobacillus bengalensis TaxID=1435466 RepID=A0A494YST8_9BACI|nr:competence protein ComK [Oceanobacillus bengalensis]RKQ13190.1 competence protein [Oceanobacillus bengalensis]
MCNIQSRYSINHKTMILLPVKHTDYDTIVVEQDRHLFVQQTTTQLIRTACLDNCSTYEGTRTAVMHKTGFKRKVPIPINRSKRIYTFPTHSTNRNFLSCWVFYQHVEHIRNNPFAKTSNPSAIITFNNMAELKLEAISSYALKQQMRRTFACIREFSTEELQMT